MHTHDTCLWALLTMNVVTDLRGGDRSLQLLPMFHVGALTPATFRVHRGATLVAARSFDARGTWALMVGERIRVMLAVPAMPNVMWQVPERDARDRSPLRWMLSGAVPVPVVLIRRYAAVGIEVHQSYGLTGTCGPACVIGAEHATSRPAPPARTSFTPASAW